jgi:quinol monooxygenase YgiN
MRPEETSMYGLIGKMRCIPGRRKDVIEAMDGNGAKGMPGCQSFWVSEDPVDGDCIWVTEVWDSEAAHKASLELPAVKASIARAMPLIAGFELNVKTRPVAGV